MTLLAHQGYSAVWGHLLDVSSPYDVIPLVRLVPPGHRTE